MVRGTAAVVEAHPKAEKSPTDQKQTPGNAPSESVLPGDVDEGYEDDQVTSVVACRPETEKTFLTVPAARPHPR